MGCSSTRCYYLSSALVLVALELILIGSFHAMTASGQEANDDDLIEFSLNLEFMEAEFHLNAVSGQGLEAIDPYFTVNGLPPIRAPKAPYFTVNGPPPIGAQKANLDPMVASIIEEFSLQQIGHIRAIFQAVGGFPRPLLNLSRENFAKLFDQAVGFRLTPPFDPYANSINFLLATYFMPYIGLNGYVGAIPNLVNQTSRGLVASLLGVKAGQDALVRGLLNQRARERVLPYNFTVAEFTNKISELRNRLGRSGNKDEGLGVSLTLGAENLTVHNVLSADANSLSYARTPPEILRIVYGTGDERKPGGFFPKGANGKIARSFIES